LNNVKDSVGESTTFYQLRLVNSKGIEVAQLQSEQQESLKRILEDIKDAL
jgi:hypothetical protein